MNDTNAQATNGTLPPVPPKIAAAICEVMSAVPKLKKGEKNTHGNYNFASIDDFLEAVRPLCAEQGLIIIIDEEGFETKEGQDKNGKSVTWLVLEFAFTLAHSSGETWGHRPRRTIMVNASMGSQAFGAAQSYALKQFERALFQIATGEKDGDADSHPHGDLPRTARRGAVKRGQANGGNGQKSIDLMDAADGSIKSFPRTGNGALAAIAYLEDSVERNPDNWQANRAVALHLAEVSPALQPDPTAPTIKERVETLDAQTTQTPLAAG
jgi:hypothetical protein